MFEIISNAGISNTIVFVFIVGFMIGLCISTINTVRKSNDKK